jgi:Zn-dependent metalloprotease
MASVPPDISKPRGTGLRRAVYDAEHTSRLPGKLVRREGDNAVNDLDIDRLYDYLGIAYDFFKQVFNRNSFDNRGSEIVAIAHFQKSFNNAFWDGTRMVFGDGDGRIF